MSDVVGEVEGAEGRAGDGRIGIAIVGLGIGRMHMIACAELADRYRVVVVCDTDAERSREVAGWLPGVRAETDLAAVLAAPDVEVVDLCTPPAGHRDQIEACLRAGKDVVCEKPFVGSVREVDEIAALCQETGRTVMPILQYRFGRGLQRLRHLVEEGWAGRPYVANVEMAWRREADYYAVPWRGRWATELGGIVSSLAVHAIDMTTYVLGPPVAVWCRRATLVHDIEVEDSAVATFRFASGALATLSATVGSAVEVSRHRFTFEHLSAESGTAPYTNGEEPWAITTADPDRQEAVDALVDRFADRGEDYVGQFERYAEARATGGPLPVTLTDVRTVLEVVTAMYVSSRTDREVPLPLAADDPALGGWQP